jgi:hypothetical protein
MGSNPIALTKKINRLDVLPALLAVVGPRPVSAR